MEGSMGRGKGEGEKKRGRGRGSSAEREGSRPRNAAAPIPELGQWEHSAGRLLQEFMGLRGIALLCPCGCSIRSTSDVLYSMAMRRMVYSVEAAQYRSIVHTPPGRLFSVKLCRILLSICSAYMSCESNYHTCSCPSLHNIQIIQQSC